MLRLLLLSLLIIASGADSDIGANYEVVGNGHCAMKEECTDGYSCMVSSFYRHHSAQHSSTVIENCVQDAIKAGAEAFAVSVSMLSCEIFPKEDPGLEDMFPCNSASNSKCPAPSPYGGQDDGNNYYYNYYYDDDDPWDWEWRVVGGGTAPVLGVYTPSVDKGLICYRVLSEAETEAEAAECDNITIKSTCIGTGTCSWGKHGSSHTRRKKSCFLKECREFTNRKKCTGSDVGEELGCEWKGKRCQDPGSDSGCDADNKPDCWALGEPCEWERKTCRKKVVLYSGCGQYDSNSSCKKRKNWPNTMDPTIVCTWVDGVCTEHKDQGCPAFKTRYECLRPLGVLFRCKWSGSPGNRGCQAK